MVLSLGTPPLATARLAWSVVHAAGIVGSAGRFVSPAPHPVVTVVPEPVVVLDPLDDDPGVPDAVPDPLDPFVDEPCDDEVPLPLDPLLPLLPLEPAFDPPPALPGLLESLPLPSPPGAPLAPPPHATAKDA
jgi:hypothetical protein